MAQVNANSLADAGCDAVLSELCEYTLLRGDTEECLRLLRAHRCDLVEAMHEAQRPIDVCDWIIREVEKNHA